MFVARPRLSQTSFYGGCMLCRVRIFVRFYELFAADPVLGCLLDYSDSDVPRDPKVHGRRFGLWLLARFPCHTNLCRHNSILSFVSDDD